MREENKNLIVAIALSMAVLLGWQYFFAAPEAERQRQAAQQQQSTQVNPERTEPARKPEPGRRRLAHRAGNGSEHAVRLQLSNREAALARSPRVAIDTPAIPARSTCAAAASTTCR